MNPDPAPAASPVPVASARPAVEVRDASGTHTLLGTVGGGMKVSRDLTTLSRVTLSKTTAPDGERIYDNLMFGVAWRETDRNQWNALAKVQLICKYMNLQERY